MFILNFPTTDTTKYLSKKKKLNLTIYIFGKKQQNENIFDFLNYITNFFELCFKIDSFLFVVNGFSSQGEFLSKIKVEPGM